MKGEMELTADTVTEANTLLTYTESNMHKALWEFGNAKFSEAAQKIMEFLGNADGPVLVDSLWECVSMNLDKYFQIFDVLDNLQKAGKISIAKATEFHSVMLNKATLKENLPGVDYERYIKEAKI